MVLCLQTYLIVSVPHPGIDTIHLVPARPYLIFSVPCPGIDTIHLVPACLPNLLCTPPWN